MSEDWGYIATKSGYKNEFIMWENMYLLQGMSLQEIANEVGVSKTAIRNRLRRNSITLEPQGGSHPSSFTKAVRANPRILMKLTDEICRQYKITPQTVNSTRKHYYENMCSTPSSETEPDD